MPSLLTTSTAGLSLPPKKLKSCCTYSALLCFAWFPITLNAADISSPPKPGEQTQTSPVNENPPPALPEEPKPESDDSRNLPKTVVTIVNRKNARIEEYRVNGQLRYVKIIPSKGKPYYMVDKDGDGELETRHSDLDGIPPINEWILLKW